LENGKGTDNEISRRVWKEIKTGKTDKARMVEAKRKKEKREEFRRLTIKEEIVIARIVEEKKEKRNRKEDLIELRIVKEMVLKRFHKYLKVFEKK